MNTKAIKAFAALLALAVCGSAIASGYFLRLVDGGGSNNFSSSFSVGNLWSGGQATGTYNLGTVQVTGSYTDMQQLPEVTVKGKREFIWQGFDADEFGNRDYANPRYDVRSERDFGLPAPSEQELADMAKKSKETCQAEARLLYDREKYLCEGVAAQVLQYGFSYAGGLLYLNRTPVAKSTAELLLARWKLNVLLEVDPKWVFAGTTVAAQQYKEICVGRAAERFADRLDKCPK
jgi:hypothetical protein